jgi:hypothetical protein
MAKVARWTLRGGAVLALLALGLSSLVFVLNRTQRGQTFVLSRAISFVQGRIDGDLRVEGIHSSGLLGGFTLRGISLTDEAGRSFVTADSAEVRYALGSLLAGDVVLNRVRLWNPAVVLEPQPGDNRLNVLGIFRVEPDTLTPEASEGVEVPEGGEPVPPGRLIAIRELQVEGGSVAVRVPVSPDAPAPDPGDEGLVIPRLEVPGVGEVLEISAQELSGRVEDLRILDPGSPGQRMDIRTLQGLVRIFDEPVRVADVRGELAVTGDSVLLEAERFWLTETETAGRLALALGREELDLAVELEATVLRLADFRWLLPDLPDGTGSGDVQVRILEGETRVAASGVEVVSGRSRVRGGGEVTLPARGGPRLTGVDVEFLPLGLDLVQRFAVDTLPLPEEGLIRGRVRADGRLDALRLAGQLTLTGVGREPTTVQVEGTLHADGDLGGTGLSVVAEPLDYALLGDLIPGGLPLTGTGRVTGTLDGRFGQELMVDLIALHQAPGLPDSNLEVRGMVRGREEELSVELEGLVQPLSLDALARDWPALPVSGLVRGSVTARGSLSDLGLELALDTPGGLVTGMARLDARNPAAGYSGEVELEAFDVARMVDGVPDSTLITGILAVEGEGMDPESLVASVRLALEPSRVAGLPLDGASLTARVGGGHVTVAALEIRSPAIRLSGAGVLALEEWAGPILLPGEVAGDPLWLDQGEGGIPTLPPLALPGAADTIPALRLEIQETDLEALRPWLMPGATIARDELSPLDLEVLRLEGVDPDTLPSRAELALGGDLQGEVVLRGALTRFRLDGALAFQELAWGLSSLEEGTVHVSLRDPLHPGSPLAGRITTRDVSLGERRFDSVVAFLGLVDGAGVAAARVSRTPPPPGGDRGEDRPLRPVPDTTVPPPPAEEIRFHAPFTLDSVGTLEARLEELVVSSRDVDWSLANPALFQRDSMGIRIVDFHLRRPEPGGVRIQADGRLPVQGEADFTLSVEDLDLSRLVSLLQLDLELEGVVDLQSRVTGTAAAPLMEGSLEANDLRWANVPLERVEGGFTYADRRISMDVLVDEEGRRVLTADLSIPADLAFGAVEERFPRDELDGEIVVREFPAAIALSILDLFQEVEGAFSGNILLAGTLEDLSPTGRITLVGGAATLEAVGVRYTEVGMEGTLQEGGVIQVEGSARAGGGARVAGTVDVSDLTNPAFDLAITASGFQAASRRDVEGRFGGTANLAGSFRDPLITGDLRVEQGNLFLDEFVRASTVVDLTDPTFFDVVDTTLISVRPVLEASQNPFLQNLRMDVGLTLERDVWLRSNQINVEIAGELATLFNRPRKEIVLVGQLQAVRGSYNGFGRRFEIQQGIVEFSGNPGINPRLDIEAATRLRTSQEVLNITASLQGTLLQPSVSLGSDSEPPLAESELASYLIFGRPSSFLSAGERSVVSGATGAGVSLGLGIVANQLGSAVAQQLDWLDYLAITTPTDTDLLGAGAVRGSVAATQFELGQYLTDEVFVALVIRPLSSFGQGGQNQFSGARVEWRFSDSWTVEAFVEDRFSRGAFSGFQDIGISSDQIMGLLLFRDWGY